MATSSIDELRKEFRRISEPPRRGKGTGAPHLGKASLKDRINRFIVTTAKLVTTLFLVLFVWSGVYYWYGLTPEQRAQSAKESEARWLERAAASHAVITLKADIAACDSVDAYQAERDANSNVCVVLPKGTEIEFAPDAFSHDGDFWWVRTVAGSDNGLFGARAMSKDEAQFDVRELPKLDKGQFRVTARDYGDDWPFTSFAAGVVTCKVEKAGSYNGQQATRPIVTIKLGDTIYGLNGAAMGAGGYPDPKSWRKRNESGYFEVGVREIDDWIQRALANCNS